MVQQLTDEQTDRFRVAYKLYQDRSRVLGVSQKDLLEATGATYRLLGPSKSNASPEAIDAWDAAKATAAAAAIESLATHHRRVADAMHDQADALKQVTLLASSLIEAP